MGGRLNYSVTRIVYNSIAWVGKGGWQKSYAFFGAFTGMV